MDEKADKREFDGMDEIINNANECRTIEWMRDV